MVYLNDIQDFETAAQELFKQQPLRTFCWIKAKSFFAEGDHHFVGFYQGVHPCSVGTTWSRVFGLPHFDIDFSITIDVSRFLETLRLDHWRGEILLEKNLPKWRTSISIGWTVLAPGRAIWWSTGTRKERCSFSEGEDVLGCGWLMTRVLAQLWSFQRVPRDAHAFYWKQAWLVTMCQVVLKVTNDRICLELNTRK